ncbi:hypothetical protein L596_000868 [Steinernema carpocapsae]|uniref:Uncharacterized protein n=1 Tax=Steinernema carpocapsae TaxID=34508 RepID=A0A4U8UJT4_STECR|nr:hypothetical protein L596_000868 [Steinernema carpocapsae]
MWNVLLKKQAKFQISNQIRAAVDMAYAIQVDTAQAERSFSISNPIKASSKLHADDDCHVDRISSLDTIQMEARNRAISWTTRSVGFEEVTCARCLSHS